VKRSDIVLLIFSWYRLFAILIAAGLSPASGTTPATLTVRPSPAGLVPALYNTTITFSFADGRTFVVPVTLSVSASINVTAFANAASFAGALGAPNTLMTAFGNFPGCTSSARVSIDGVPTPVFASSPAQINFLVPAAVAGKPSAIVQIACAGLTSQPVPMQIAVASPGVFTVSQSGSGQAAIVNQDGTLAPPSPRGTVVTFYGTGFGVLAGASSDGLSRTVFSVTASVGGEAATVTYAGEAPGYTSGLQQINILIPMDSPVGGSVPLQMTVGGMNTPAGATLAIQ